MDDLTRRSFGFDASNLGAEGVTKQRPAKSNPTVTTRRFNSLNQRSTATHTGSSAVAPVGGFYTDPSVPFSIPVDSPSRGLKAEVEKLKRKLRQKEEEVTKLKQQCAHVPKLQQKVHHYKKTVHELKAAAAAAAAAASTAAPTAASLSSQVTPSPGGSAAAHPVHSTPRANRTPVTISPNIFSVTKHHGVQRLKLARCASMGTKRSLMEAEMHRGVPAGDGIAERVIQVGKRLLSCAVLVAWLVWNELMELTL